MNWVHAEGDSMSHGVNLILCTVTNAMLQLVTFVQQVLLFATFLPCNPISVSRAAITMSHRHKSILKHSQTHHRSCCIHFSIFSFSQLQTLQTALLDKYWHVNICGKT